MAFASISTQTQVVTKGTLRPDQDLSTFTIEKQKLSDEYASMLRGKEAQAVYEKHHLAFMLKWSLGNSQNLHTSLTKSRTQVVAAQQAKLAQNACPAITGTEGGILPNCVIPPTLVGAAQFPEAFRNYCSNATIATTLVEDSFVWPGTTANTTGYTRNYIYYDPYSVAQPITLAQADEDMLTSVTYELWNYAPRDHTIVGAGASPRGITYTLNQFVYGKGGWYTYVPGSNNFQQNLITDVNQGWDVPVGIRISNIAYALTLPGWPTYENIRTQKPDVNHWIAATSYSNGGYTTEYADPVWQAPDYIGWGINPHWTMPTSDLMQLMSPWGYIW